MMQTGAPEGAEERGLQAPQEYADEHQEGDVDHQHHAMRPGDGDVVVGQEDELT